MDSTNEQNQVITTEEVSESVVTNVEESASEEKALTRKEKKKQKKALKKEKKLQKKLAKKEKKKRWKETKKEDRRKLKEHYKDAPWFIRIPRLLIGPVVKISLWAILVIAILSIIGGSIYGAIVSHYTGLYDNRYAPVSTEEIEEISPYDKEGAEKIAAMPGIGEDETWTICVYIVGADLEDWDENDLSLATKYDTSKEREARNQAVLDNRFAILEQYSSEINKVNLRLPEFLYYPEKPIASSSYVMDEVVVATQDGAASLDMEEMFMSEMSDNIQVVVQTGGATRWSNTFINPNKTQRFLIKNDTFEEVSNLPLERSTDPATLAEFLRFCNKNYKSDHNILVLWDHGAGPFGYGVDSIYGGEIMSLKDVRQALSMVYSPNEDDPAFDIIGYDACLMSNLEVAHSLNGFASYYVLSEESEPGEGWDYYEWLRKMSDNPTMSPAAVAQAAADTFTDYYITQNVNLKPLKVSRDVTMSVLDAKKTEELYDAYCELTKQQLIDSVSDISVLAEIGRCSDKSTHVASDAYNVYNLVDLGNYVDYMVDTYPNECTKISNLLEEAVLYHRENGSLCDAEGLSVYLPGSIDSFAGLLYFLKYEYNICEDDYTRALYYYKMSGCLNDEMLELIKPITNEKPTVLDISMFNKFEKTMPVTADNSFSVPIDEKLQKMIQAYTFVLASYDEYTGEIVYFGQDEYAYLDGEGNMECEFEGEWIHLDGQPLYIEATSASASAIEYRSRILYNGKEAYLIFSYDRDTEDFAIKGVRLIPSEDGDQINFLVSTKDNIELQRKDTIVPLYYAYDAYGQTYDKEGKKIKYRSTTKIHMKGLDTGYYLGMLAISDQRGDSYSSKVLGYDITNGKVKECKVDKDFVGADY
ncbi:MAG: hypothetical protein K5654_06350 [Lachnospiraceae bacterium]|nr:hypothetical protein [Lachnospiraceae bacterium]